MNCVRTENIIVAGRSGGRVVILIKDFGSCRNISTGKKSRIKIM